MQITITFDPDTATLDKLTAAIAGIYGTVAPHAPATIHPDDNPEAGEAADTPTAATSASGTPTKDATGLPWDARIHSTPASLTAKGVWRSKRGVDDALVASVTAELKGAVLPAAPPAPPAPAPLPTPSTTPSPTPYESFAAWISDHLAKGTSGITEDWLKAVLTQYGVEGGLLPNLAHAAPDLIASLRTAIAGALRVEA